MVTTEVPMRVYVVDSRYTDEAVVLNISDVPSIPFLNSRFPLYVGVRQGQVLRMQKAIKQEKLGGVSVGIWNLSPYISKKGKINWDELNKHDVIFFANPDRICEKYTNIYTELIKLVSDRLC
jgi:hypothetical protein